MYSVYKLDSSTLQYKSSAEFRRVQRQQLRKIMNNRFWENSQFFHVLFSVTESFILGFHEGLIIFKRATKKHTSKKEPTSVSEISTNIIFAQQYFNSSTLSIWVAYKYISI